MTDLALLHREPPLPVREFERRSGIQTTLALTWQVGLGQWGVDLLYRFGGPAFIDREWDRTVEEALPYDAIALNPGTATWAAPAEWWAYVCNLDRGRIAAGLPGPVAIDPLWRPRPVLRPTPQPVLDPSGVIEGEWH